MKLAQKYETLRLSNTNIFVSTNQRLIKISAQSFTFSRPPELRLYFMLTSILRSDINYYGIEQKTGSAHLLGIGK